MPTRSQFPVKVTVVAYQWCRSIEPRLKSAEPVVQTFFILKPNQNPPSDEQLAEAAKVRCVLWASVAAAAKAVAQTNLQP